MLNQQLNSSPLGKQTSYASSYDPSLLFPIARKVKRDEIFASENPPFQGVDVWTAYELSWLNLKGKPQVAIGEFYFPAESECIIESKSFKLYLNSFNQTKLSSIEEFKNILEKDLSHAAKTRVQIKLIEPAFFSGLAMQEFPGIPLDDLDIEIDCYSLNLEFLKTEKEHVEEKLFTNLLKSNCLITNQPDWASLFIHYSGPKINHEGLLKYLVSFRTHNEFHEQCIERIFMDLHASCKPEKLTVYGRYTRRGGLDINPFRSNFDSFKESKRLARQ